MAAAPLPPTVPSAAPEAAPLSEGARIINTFIAPSKTFTDLRRNASWWAPWLLISIFSVAFLFTIGKQIGYEQAARYQIAHSTRASQLPADQQERQVQFSVKIFQGITYGFPVAILFFTVIPTLVLWVTFKVGFSAETTFGQAFAIGMYAGLPNIINAILGIISLFAGVNPEGFDSNNPVGTNLAYYLDPDTTNKFVRGMASSLDLIIIWTIVLLGIGYASTSKVKKSTAIIVVACWYLAWKLITSGLATLG
jgi:Yip1 domain